MRTLRTELDNIIANKTEDLGSCIATFGYYFLFVVLLLLIPSLLALLVLNNERMDMEKGNTKTQMV